MKTQLPVDPRLLEAFPAAAGKHLICQTVFTLEGSWRSYLLPVVLMIPPSWSWGAAAELPQSCRGGVRRPPGHPAGTPNASQMLPDASKIDNNHKNIDNNRQNPQDACSKNPGAWFNAPHSYVALGAMRALCQVLGAKPFQTTSKHFQDTSLGKCSWGPQPSFNSQLVI